MIGNWAASNADSNVYIRARHDENSIVCEDDGRVTLYYDNVKTFGTCTNGAEVFASEGNDASLYIHADEADDLADQWRLRAWAADQVLTIESRNSSGYYEKNIACIGDGAVELYHDNSKKFETTSNGATLTGNHLKIDGNNGEKIILTGTANPYIRFHETSTEKFYMQWNSAGYFELYNQETSKALRIGGSGAEVLDSVKFTAGNSQDLQLYHDGSNSHITNTYDSGYLHIKSDNISLAARSVGENMLLASKNGAVTLFYDGSTRLATTSAGVTVTGIVDSTSDIKLKENIKTIENSLDKVLKLRGVEFDWKESKEHSIGVIAQEVEEVLPELVHETKGTKTVSYGNITAVLIEAIKEQNEIINNMKKEIEELKNS